MCDRTKVEILARELCVEFYRGQLKYMPKEQVVSIKQYVEEDENWKDFILTATRTLEILEKHK